MSEDDRANQYLRYVRSGINLQVENCLNVVNRLMGGKDNGDSRDRDAAIRELRAGLAEYIRAEAELEDSIKALQQLRDRMRTLQDDENDQEIDVDKMYEEIRARVERTLSEVEVEKHSAMAEFDRKCSRREQPDTEMEMEGEEIVATQVNLVIFHHIFVAGVG